MKFRVIPPQDGRPVLFDDACYYLSFTREEPARMLAEMLNGTVAQRFLRALSFEDAKRPVTIDLLQRLDLAAIAQAAGLGPRWERLQSEAKGDGSAPPRVRQTEMVMELPEE